VDAKELVEKMREAGLIELPVTARHTVAAAQLPLLHRDPFDRLAGGAGNCGAAAAGVRQCAEAALLGVDCQGVKKAGTEGPRERGNKYRGGFRGRPSFQAAGVLTKFIGLL
jgi:hypothetical protein